MYVVASEAASLLKISHRRLLELLRKGRVKGAYKSGRFWVIPLYNKLPYIIPGKRGKKGNWKKTRLPRKTIVHVNRNRITENMNKSPQERKPVIAVKTSNSTLSKNANFYTNQLEIPYPCRIIYQPDKPLSCGATLWIEVLGENLEKAQPPENILIYNRDVFKSDKYCRRKL